MTSSVSFFKSFFKYFASAMEYTTLFSLCIIPRLTSVPLNFFGTFTSTTFPVRGGRSQIREGMMERCREVRDEIATSPYGHLAMTWIQVGQLIARSPKLSVNNSF